MQYWMLSKMAPINQMPPSGNGSSPIAPTSWQRP
jgi:hypothetical protein